jgi:hypothetical protein
MGFFKETDHCTRCHTPLGEEIVFMVRQDDVVWQIIGLRDSALALTQTETVPVCKACLTVEEDTKPWRERICSGCGGVK